MDSASGNLSRKHISVPLGKTTNKVEMPTTVPIDFPQESDGLMVLPTISDKSIPEHKSAILATPLKDLLSLGASKFISERDLLPSLTVFIPLGRNTVTEKVWELSLRTSHPKQRPLKFLDVRFSVRIMRIQPSLDPAAFY